MNFEDFSSFFAPLNSASTSSTLDRLQSLADSLPTQIYDRNGNLMPLNSHNPPMSFFEMGGLINKNITNLTENVKTVVPIFEREGVDWSKVSLTSILKKIVPEEIFLQTDQTEETKENYSNTSVTESEKIVNNIKFTMLELRLLDKEQLHSLAKHLNIKVSTQTDHKLEQEIFSTCNSEGHKRIGKNSVSKEKISWTEENENLLIKMYEELRIEKRKVDQKLQSLLTQTTSSASAIASSNVKCKGSIERGMWAVLADQMRHASKFHVSVSECRNKVIILKRLKH